MKNLFLILMLLFLTLSLTGYREYLPPEDRPVVEASPTPEIVPTKPIGNTIPAITEQIVPKTNPWIAIHRMDTGYCGPEVERGEPGILPPSGSGWSGNLSPPLKIPMVVNPGRGFSANHTGIDINAPVGTPVYAMNSGLVVWTGFNVYGFGNLVVLAHGGGYQTFYAHLTEVTVNCFDVVNVGQQIGTSGQTGLSTWPALHIEVRYFGIPKDPARWLE